MRVSFTGAAGIGKTTVAKSLATHLGYPLLEEDLQDVVLAFNPRHSSDAGQNIKDKRRRACLEWLNRRATLYQRTPDFVEDRCAVDILFRWLLGDLSDKNNAATDLMLTRTRSLVQQTDFLVILPLHQAVDETVNEKGLLRARSMSRLLKSQSLAIGLAHQLADPAKIITVPRSCTLIEDRLSFIVEKIGRLS